MSTSEMKLDGCNCCGPADDVPELFNAPGLDALRHRVGVYAQFRDRILRSLPLETLSGAGGPRPLDALTVRSPDDATVALVDAFANVADVLTFYQERIANEGYLRTATERRSVLELARAIGYELSPGVAASAYLSFTVEDAPGAPRQSLLPKGLQVQSVPPQGKAPQIFETSNEFQAYAEWNALRPRLTRRAEMAILSADGTLRLVLLVPAGSVPAGTGVYQNVTDAQTHRLDPPEPGAGAMDAVEVRRIYLTQDAPALSKGEILLFAGGEGADRVTLLRGIVDVVAEPERKRIRVDIEPLAAPAAGVTAVPYILFRAFTFATVTLAPLAFSRASLATNVIARAWRERDLRALAGIQGWNRFGLARAVNAPPRPPKVPPASGAFSFREHLAFFGHNAPKWSSLPKNATTNGTPYTEAWDAGDKGTNSPSDSRLVWQNSQGTANPDGGPHAYLERAVSGIAPGSWTVFESPTAVSASPPVSTAVWTVHSTQDASKADFGLSGRSTTLTLGDATTGTSLTTLPTQTFHFRDTTAHIASRRLKFAELSIEDPVQQGEKAIELNQMVVGLAVGQPIVLTGEREDTPGIDAAEVAFLADIIHAGGRTTLVLRTELQYSYVREKLVISANVAQATHGETVQEVLGSGDGSRRNQRFTLSKSPLTYVSAPTPRGSASTLEVRVNDVLWEEVPSLYGLAPNRQAYVVRIDDDARARITFGDGVSGARVLTGTANITARYRSGIGPDGEVDAVSLTVLRTMPLGLRSVTNALPGAGAEGPEKLADARRNAPRTVLTFERVVSLLDHEDFARTFPGIGKALADVLWTGSASVIHLTVAGATGGAPSVDVLNNLRDAIAKASDSSQSFIVSAFAQRFFTSVARITVDPRYQKDVVLAAVEDRIRTTFSFEARQFGQSVTSAEVLAAIHEVPGVIAVDLEILAPYAEDSSGTAAPATPAGSETGPVVAHRASWDASAREAVPAELLLVNPVGITLETMLP